MKKAEIRKIYTEKRANLNSEDYTKLCQSVHDVLFSRIMMHRFSPIHIFLPIIEKKEVNTHLIIKTLQKDFAPDIFVPKVKENELIHIHFTDEIPIKTSKWGVPEPEESKVNFTSETFFKKYTEEDILVLIPLLAFDKTGNRVGYGKGFYDDFLKYASANTNIMGLSLFDALAEPITDCIESDIQMNFCVSPGKVWTF
jgi:5-formyltetrahydrofolate cyclo-ligase